MDKVRYNYQYIPEHCKKTIFNLMMYGRAYLFDNPERSDRYEILAEYKNFNRDGTKDVVLLRVDRDYYDLAVRLYDDNGDMLMMATLDHWQFAKDYEGIRDDEFELFIDDKLDAFKQRFADEINELRLENLV